MISCPILFYLFINLLTISQVLWCSSAAASSASYQAMTRRRLVSASRTDARLTSSATATIGTSSRPGRACSFYIWNAPSALLHKWCQHVMKDHIYEGRGGVKFVRIEPGSVLQLLYPCSRYSPDSCLFCGGTFLDHMTLAWAKRLYTPFDRYLDWVRDKGMIMPTGPEPDTKRGTRNTTTNHGFVRESMAPRHVFHRRYVQDREEMGKDVLPRKTPRRRTNNSKRPEKGVFYRQCEHVTYKIPFQDVTLLRAVVLAAVESLIRWENYDDQLAKRRAIKEHMCC